MGTDHERWAHLTRTAERQDGAVATRQLTAPTGPDITARQLRTWARAARLVAVAPRVWRVAGAPVTWRLRLRAGLLSLGPDAVVSHEAAAALHGFDRTPAERVEFTVPREQRTARLPDTLDADIHSSTRLGPLDRLRVADLPVTSATRTIIDLANVRVDPRRLEAAIDSAVRSGASAPAVIQRKLADLRAPGRWGCRAIDAALVHAGGHTMLERLFLELMSEIGAPRPTTQRVHRDGDRTIARVDFEFDDLGIVVEVSGRVGHSTPAERARDAQRRNELQDIGRRVYEYTWEDVTRRPAFVRDTMRERLVAAGWVRTG